MIRGEVSVLSVASKCVALRWRRCEVEAALSKADSVLKMLDQKGKTRQSSEWITVAS